MRRSQLLLSLCSLAAMIGLSPAASGQVVISQVYGGAGAAGATYNQDFVELFNRGPIAVDLSTWSLQYASATGNSWGKTNLVGSIPSGGYYLVALGSGTGTSPLPVTADATGATQMAAAAGKLALVTNQTLLGTVYCFAPGQNGVADFVGYGAPTSSNVYGWEGSGPTGTNLSTILAAYRKNGGCTDTNNNSADFDAPAAPLPRNSATIVGLCAGQDPSGACCLSNGTCQYLTSAACGMLSGTYAGDFVPCAQGTYTVTNDATPLLDISSVGALQTGGGTSQITASAPLPFPITYFGQTFNNFRATNNGYMTLCNTYGASLNTNTALPTTAAPICTVAPLWDSFTTATTTTGKLYVYTNGAPPLRQFIVQWQTVPPQTGGGTVDKNTFQVIFNESSQVIEFRYGAIVGDGAPYTGGSITASPSVGFEDFSGLNGINIIPGTLGAGGDAAAQQFTPTGQCPTTGACCRAGSCFASTALGCTVGGGAFAGDFSTCGSTSCIAGACCKPNNTCAEALTAAQCAAMSGLYQGDNVACSATVCPSTGSCCIGTVCSIAFQSICTTSSGTWTSGGSCGTNLCAGSCCNPVTNMCTLAVDALSCGMSNSFAGAGSTCTTNPCPAPINDTCGGAIIIPTSSLGTTILGGNGSATSEVSGTAPNCTVTTNLFGVWYSFTPALSRVYTASTCNALTQGNNNMRVFHLPAGGDCSTGLQCVGGNANDTTCTAPLNSAAAVTFSGAAGATYYILICVDGGLTGPFGLTVTDTGLPAPGNDVCSTATPLTIGSSTPGTTVNATTVGQPSTSCNTITPTKAGVWYTFTTGPNPQRLIATTCDPATDFDSMLFLYSGSCASLTCVWGNDTGIGCPTQTNAAMDPGNTTHSYAPAIINWTASTPAVKCTTPNTTYYLLVTISSATPTNALQVAGNFVLHLEDTGETCEGIPPAHNACTSARVLSSFPYWDIVFRGDALSSPDVSCNEPANLGARGSIWYSFSPVESGNLFHAKIPDQGAAASSTDTVLTLYSAAPDCSALTEVACVDAVEGFASPAFSTPVAHLAPGTTYYAMVSTFGATVTLPGAEYVGFSFVADPGACCIAGVCSITNGSGPCAAAMGTFRGQGSTCSPDPCAAVAGVCCRGATCTTAITSSTACAAATTTTSTGGPGWRFVNTASPCNAGVNADGTYSAGLTSTTSPCCFANYNHNTTLEVQDIFDFLNDWFAGRAIAIPGGDGTSHTGLAVQNIFNFLNAWFAGGCN